LTESIDEPLVDYDGIWVAGLSAESGPAPPRADPFVPIGAQRSVGYQPASAHGQLDAARQAMSAWQRCTAQLVMSWPCADGDVPLQPSQLLGVPPRAHGVEVAAASADRLMVSPVRTRGVSGDPWNGHLLGRGPAAHRRQSLATASAVPFKAVAELRLGALRVSEPRPGLDRPRAARCCIVR
jgi:hypothetical protein